MKHIPVLLNDLPAIAKPRHMDQEGEVARFNPDSLANQLSRAALINRRILNVDKLSERSHP